MGATGVRAAWKPLVKKGKSGSQKAEILTTKPIRIRAKLAGEEGRRGERKDRRSRTFNGQEVPKGEWVCRRVKKRDKVRHEN